MKVVEPGGIDVEFRRIPKLCCDLRTGAPADAGGCIFMSPCVFLVLRKVTLLDKSRAPEPNDEREWDHPGLINGDLKVR